MKQILITGASSGLGLGMAKSLGAKGHRVHAGVLNEKELNNFEQIKNVVPIILDVTKNDQIASVKNIFTDGLDVLICNAGIGIGGPLLEVQEKEMFKLFNVNVFGSIKIIQTVIDLLMASKGHIIVTSSLNGHIPSPYTPLYAMSKYAIEAMTEAMRIEFSSFDIKITTLNPGLYHSRMLYKMKDELSQKGMETKYHNEFYERMKEFDPTGLGREISILGADVVKIVESKNPPARFISGDDKEHRETFDMIINRLRDLMKSSGTTLEEYLTKESID